MNIPYASALVVSAAISAAVGITALRKRPAPGAAALAFVSASLFAWSLPYAVSWLVTTPSQQHLWLLLSYLGVVTGPPAAFVLVAQYTRRERLLTRAVRAVLIAEPIATLVILWTDPLHGWFFGGVPATTRILSGGVWFWVSSVFGFGLVLLGAILLASELAGASRVRRKQVSVLLLAMLLPFAGALIGVLGASPFPDIDLTPFAFTASGALFGYGLFRLGLLGLMPVARETLIESMHDGVMVFDADALLAYFNPAAAEMLDLTRSCIGKPADEVLAAWPRELAEVRAGAQDIVAELPGPEPRFIQTSVQRVADKRGAAPLASLVTLRDVTDRQRAQMAIEQSEYQYRLLSETMMDVIWTLDMETMRFVYVSPSVEALRGYTPAEVKAQTIEEALTPESLAYLLDVVPQRMAEFLAGGASRGPASSDELVQPCKDGGTVVTEVVSRFIRDERTGRIFTVAVTRDITERKRLRDELARQATTDGLTGVANRRRFEELAEAELKRSARYGHEVTIAIVDIDGLKHINDTYGHLAGDEAIIRVAAALQAVVRDTDTVARFGGDEFVVLAPQTDAEGARAMMERALEQVLRQPAGPDQSGLPLSFSYGVGSSNATHRTLDEVIAEADAALYESKRRVKPAP